LFARGIRNAEGLSIVPGTNTLWVVINNRDDIAYPNHNDWSGDGTDDYGKVMQSYVGQPSAGRVHACPRRRELRLALLQPQSLIRRAE
jgi:hypothetical protein